MKVFQEVKESITQTHQDKNVGTTTRLTVVPPNDPPQEEDWGCAPQSEEPQPLDDTEINQTIKQFQQNLDDWEFYGTSFSKLIEKFHEWSVELWSRFIPSRWNDKPVSRPELLFKFQREGRRVLGHYHRGRNDTGLKYEISINPGWLVVRTEAQTAAVVLHELMHTFEDIVGISSKSRNNYHKNGSANMPKASVYRVPNSEKRPVSLQTVALHNGLLNMALTA